MEKRRSDENKPGILSVGGARKSKEFALFLLQYHTFSFPLGGSGTWP